MNLFLKPAVLLLNRLNYSRKLAVVGVVLALPLCTFSYFTISEVNSRIAAVEKELIGVRAIRPMKRLTKAIQEHRGASQMALNGSQTAQARLPNLESTIGDIIQEIDEFERAVGKTLETTEEWESLKGKWRYLNTKTNLAPAESFRLHTDLIKGTTDLLAQSSDASGLLQDSELDVYYLALAVISEIPQFVENAGQARALASGAAQSNLLSDSDRIQLIKLVGSIQNADTYLVRSLNKALTATPGLKQSIAPRLLAARSAMDFFVLEVEFGLLLSTPSSDSGDILFSNGTQAVNAAYKLCESTIPALDNVLTSRLERLEYKRGLVFSAVIGALLLAAYLFWGFTAALLEHLAALRSGAKQVAALGRLETRVNISSRDEMATLAACFNDMASSMQEMVADIKETHLQVEYLANYDTLTDLPNRNLFSDRLKHLISRSAREQKKFALMFLDLDNFKAVNDTLGHDSGDMLLKEVAVRLRKCVREEDTVTRLGGDEFTVLLENGETEDVARTAQRIVDALSGKFDLAGHDAFIGVSIGIGIYPDNGADAECLLKNADDAMYQAKREGKHCYRFFAPENGSQ